MWVIFHLFQFETLVFVLFKLKEQYKDFFETPLFAFDVVYQCVYVSSIGKEDFPKNLGLFSQEPQPPSPSTSPTQKIEERFLKRNNIRCTENWNFTLLWLLIEIHQAITFSNHIYQALRVCKWIPFLSSTSNFNTGLRY